MEVIKKQKICMRHVVKLGTNMVPTDRKAKL